MTDKHRSRSIEPGRADIYTFQDCKTGQFLGFWEGACTAYPLYKMVSCSEERANHRCPWGFP